MAGFFTLLMLSIVMAVASFLAGILPLSIKMSQDRLRLISTIGMGVLVGTSLIVIIPEGVDTVYASNSISHTGNRAKRNAESYMHQVRWEHGHIEVTRAHVQAPERAVGRARSDVNPALMPGPVIPDGFSDPPKAPTGPGEMGILGAEEDPNSAADHVREEREEANHAWVGVALISGFILMFLIDKLPKSTSTTTNKPRTHHISLNNLGGRFNLTTNLDREEESENFLENNQTPESREKSSATTIGLVIHAAADGIALGASSATSNTNLSFIIFFAIMIHKAPAAFGLTSILLQQGLSKRMARAHLVIFSLAAPAGAFVTYLVTRRIVASGLAQDAQNTKWWTGILLLFSAGTFLYVAMHSMQEISGAGQHDHSANGHATGGMIEGRDASRPEPRKPSLKDLAAAVFGMILPLFLQIGHTH